MFEVGKKYKYRVNQVVYNCITAGENWAVLQFGEATPFVTQAINLYTEYKEPRTITRWVNVYEVDGELKFGDIFGSKAAAIARGDYCNTTNNVYIDCVPISYTEPL